MKFNIKSMTNKAVKKLEEHSPEILTGLGIAGMFTAVGMAVKATPKALDLIDIAEAEKGASLTRKEVVEASWKCYVPTMVMAGVSTACIVGGLSINNKRNAMLATAYSVTEAAFSEYKNKVVETVGEETAKEIKSSIIQDKMERNPVEKHEIIVVNDGTTLCYDDLSGRYFMSEPEYIISAKNEINNELINNQYASLNDFYEEIGLSYTSTGEKLGWNLDDGLIDIDFDTKLHKSKPCLVILYSKDPKYGYYKTR